MFSFYNLLLLFFFALGALRSKSHSLEAASVDGHRHPTGHSSIRIGIGLDAGESMVNRCQWLLGVGVVAGAAAQSASGLAMSESEAHKTQKRALDLSEFEPKSMLQVHENIAFTITPNDKDLGELDAANQS
jgi:hypothetical protein